MRTEPTTPVIVGVGQVVARPHGAGARPWGERPEPVDLMTAAVETAAEDCDGARAGGSAPVGRRLLERATSIRAINPLSWEYANPAAVVAERLDLDTAELIVATRGGNQPQSLVNATALAIGRGELASAVIVGADCGYTQAAARRHQARPVMPWTVQGTDVPPAVPFGSERRGTTEAEEARGLDLPIHVYPLFEHAIRAASGRAPEDHRWAVASLWARFSEVAERNPHAWIRRRSTPEELLTVSEGNRMIAPPYTKRLCADDQVDQGAALLICSLEEARAAGVDEDRLVFPLAGADADDHWFLSHRADFRSSPAIRMAGTSLSASTGIVLDDVAHLDLYSCFPSAVEIAAAELGLPIDDSSRPLTVTGGMTFSGGPGSNYGTHAIASMVDTLRTRPGSLGLVNGVGWHLSRHSVGLYGTRPLVGRPPADAPPEAPAGTRCEAAGGFRWSDPQTAVGKLPQQSPDADAHGEVSVETYSVSYDRTGRPDRAVVACRTPEGRRAWANVDDPDQLAVLVAEEACGRLGILDTAGTVDLA